MYKKDTLKNIVAIMPMAGKGSRFKKFGYETPKPLIKIKNIPMFVKATMVFSKSLNWFFIAQKYLKSEKIFKKSLTLFKNKKLIYLTKYTNGQASTVLKAIKLLKKNHIIIIHSCDLSFKINITDIKNKIKESDVLVFTAKGKKFNFKNSKQFSWVRKNLKKNKIEISMKKNFKNDKNKNRVLVGSFVFRNKDVLQNCISYMLRNNLKINNEYYIDVAASISNKIGYKLDEIIVKDYKSWGSYRELVDNK